MKKKPTPKTIPFVLSYDTKANSITFIEHRPDGSQYLVSTYVPTTLVPSMQKDYGTKWREAFKKIRLSNPEMGTTLMIKPPLPKPTTPSTPDGPSYA